MEQIIIETKLKEEDKWLINFGTYTKGRYQKNQPKGY